MKTNSRLTRTYFIGFGLSVILTLLAFAATNYAITADTKPFSNMALMSGLVVLAVTQLIVQLLYFFHLGHEAKPRLNLVSFLFMIMVIGIIGFGSIWIMYNLNYNMHGHEVEQYIEQDEGIQPETHHH